MTKPTFKLAISKRWTRLSSIVHKDVHDREYFSLCSQDLAKLIDKLRPTGFSKLAPGHQSVASVLVLLSLLRCEVAEEAG